MHNPISPAMENSPFGRLPMELRLQIYKYALSFDSLDYRPDVYQQKRTHSLGHFECPEQRSGSLWIVEKSSFHTLTSQLDLTLVCKQLREESASLVLETNSSRLHLATISRTYTSDSGDKCRTCEEFDW